MCFSCVARERELRIFYLQSAGIPSILYERTENNMKSTEKIEERVKMVDMHQYFIDRIDEALNTQRYIEASWLIYSCMENRFFRVLQKYKNQCRYCKGKSKCKKKRNELAISTKIACVKRLCESNVYCISESFTIEQLEEIKKWVKNRNDLMHELLSLSTYKDMDDRFKNSALHGQSLLSDLYKSCTTFRKIFYSDGYEFVFPKTAMEQCQCAKNSKAN